LILTALAALAGTAAFAAEIAIRPGRWEITSTIRLPGFGDTPFAEPVTTTECMAADDVHAFATPSRLFPEAICEIEVYAQTSQHLGFRAQCTEDGDTIDLLYELTVRSPTHWIVVGRTYDDEAGSIYARFEGKHAGAECSSEDLP
jgi:hypothetical protein